VQDMRPDMASNLNNEVLSDFLKSNFQNSLERTCTI